MSTKQEPRPEQPPPAEEWLESPLQALLGSLRRREEDAQRLIASGAGPEALAAATANLCRALHEISELRSPHPHDAAAQALPEIERFTTHPGRYVEPARTIYLDWTMDDSCAEVVPAKEVTVASEAARACWAVRTFLLPQSAPPVST